MSRPNWRNHKPYQRELYKLAKRKGCSDDASQYLAITIAGLRSGTIEASSVGCSCTWQRELAAAGLIEIKTVELLPWHRVDKVFWFYPEELRR